MFLLHLLLYTIILNTILLLYLYIFGLFNCKPRLQQNEFTLSNFMCKSNECMMFFLCKCNLYFLLIVSNTRKYVFIKNIKIFNIVIEIIIFCYYTICHFCCILTSIAFINFYFIIKVYNGFCWKKNCETIYQI